MKKVTLNMTISLTIFFGFMAWLMLKFSLINNAKNRNYIGSLFAFVCGVFTVLTILFLIKLT